MSKQVVSQEGGKYFKFVRRLVSFIWFIFIYVILITGSTYAFMFFSNSSNLALGEGGCFEVSYSGREITSLDIISSDDYRNGAKTFVTLSKDSSCKIYTMANIYIHTNNTTTAPIDTVPALKYKILDGDTLIAEGLVTEKNGNQLLKTVPLTDNPISYSIYLYVDSELSDGLYHDTVYSGYVYAESVQTSTIENYMVRDLSYHANNAMSYGSTIDYDEGTLTTDGVNDYVNVGLSNYDFGDSISMVVRAKANTIKSQENDLIANFESGGAGLLIDSSGIPKFSVFVNSYKYATGSTSINTNQWYVFAGVYDGSTLKLYIDGSLVASTNLVGNIKSIRQPFHLASNPNSSNNPTLFGNIVYSDVLIFDRTLTADEITSTYSDNSRKIVESKVNKNGLLAYYNFKNESSSSSSNTDASAVLTSLQNKASTVNDGVYYFDSNGDLDYGNGTKINLSLTGDIPKGVVRYFNHTLVYACMNYGANNYEYDLDTRSLSNRSMRCITDRYQNLVINGDLAYGSNLNLNDLGDYNSAGYVSNSSSSRFIAEMSDYIPVDPNKKYIISVDLKSSNTNATYYVGFKEYDADKELLYDQYVMYLPNTLTTLSRDLKNGDTVVYLNNISNWNTSTSGGYQRGLIFWNYVDSTGFAYPELTYSRNRFTYIYSDANVNKSNNTITLTNPWSGGTFASGTKVSQSNSGNEFNYSVLVNQRLTTDFVRYQTSYSITGINTGSSTVADKFRYGINFIRFAILNNSNNTANTTTYIKNINIREVE